MRWQAHAGQAVLRKHRMKGQWKPMTDEVLAEIAVQIKQSEQQERQPAVNRRRRKTA